MNPGHLFEKNTSEVINVFSKAFYDYPVMRYILRNEENYDERLQKLIGFFVAARVLRNEPMLGIYTGENILTAAAIVTLPGETPSPERLIEQREKLWQELGIEARKRYDHYGNVAGAILPSEPHHHLNMIGVIPEFKGRGFSRKIIDAVVELAAFHPNSSGLSLSTETESNVELYLHLGFKLTGNARVDDNLETWTLFKTK